jgi:nitroimidazol reductase NimA-like FMN-containing flavoprotein (pyridoxamine 5'-phosphate oxidase superfamily)
MSRSEVEAFVDEQYIARLGCHVDQTTYVVPVAYAFHDDALYCFSHEGRKLRMMRENPRVCVEIDAVVHLGSWTSVIAWGEFEELEGDEAAEGARIAAERLSTELLDTESRRRLEQALQDDPKPIIFRIRLTESTGRVEGN